MTRQARPASPELPGVAAQCKRERYWIKRYNERISAGLEACRVCGDTRELSVCRLRYDRSWTLANGTILCPEHANEYHDEFQPFRRRRLLISWRHTTPSLLLEEKRAEGRAT